MAKKTDEATRKRVRAGRLLLPGKGCAEVAAAVGVARQTVYTWKAQLEDDGIDALRAVRGRGRPAQLDGRQLDLAPEFVGRPDRARLGEAPDIGIRLSQHS